MKVSIAFGRILFAFISALVVAFSGGGFDFICRPVGAVYLGLWIVYWLVQVNRQRGEPSEFDRKQRIAYYAGVVYIPVLLVVPPWEYTNLSGPIPRDGCSAYAGLVLFAFGIIILVAAMRVLGRLYTSTLGIQHEHRLVTTGPYKYIRHPGYLGEVMSMFSVGLSLSSIVGLILGVASLVLVLVRIKPEEEMLIEHFGKEYQSYMRKTKRLIPFIY